MNIPKELKYTKTHEWVKEEDDMLLIGLTDYAQYELGDLVFLNLPEIGDDVESNEVFGDVESVKAVSDIMSPATGIVEDINQVLFDQPELINQDPYNAWLIKIKEVKEVNELMDAEAYIAFLATL